LTLKDAIRIKKSIIAFLMIIVLNEVKQKIKNPE